MAGACAQALGKGGCAHAEQSSQGLGAGCLQEGVPFKPPPRGDKDCPNACSGWGNCNHDTGLCECPAGERGLRRMATETARRLEPGGLA